MPRFSMASSTVSTAPARSIRSPASGHDRGASGCCFACATRPRSRGAGGGAAPRPACSAMLQHRSAEPVAALRQPKCCVLPRQWQHGRCLQRAEGPRRCCTTKCCIARTCTPGRAAEIRCPRGLRVYGCSAGRQHALQQGSCTRGDRPPCCCADRAALQGGRAARCSWRPTPALLLLADAAVQHVGKLGLLQAAAGAAGTPAAPAGHSRYATSSMWCPAGWPARPPAGRASRAQS